MTLSASGLKALLQTRLDTGYGSFTSLPTSVSDFKSFFKSCIDTWLADFEASFPATVNPKPTPTISGSGQALVDQLIMAIGGSVVFPTEMKAGYLAMVNATSLPPGGDYLGVGVNPISAIIPMIPTPEDDDVYASINTLCGQNNTGEAFCQEVANVLTASLVLSGKTTCTHSNTPPPPSTNMNLWFS
jgi:hypothetical protein